MIKKICLSALLIILVSCNFPTIKGNQAANFLPGATLAPLSTSDISETQLLIFSDYFVEEFDTEIPESWDTLQNWELENSIIRTSEANAQIIVPGVWQDMTFIIRFRIAQNGEMAVQFNRSTSGTYQITLSTNGISAEWVSQGAEPQTLAHVDQPIQTGWHTLFVRTNLGNVAVLIDKGEPVLKIFDATLSPKGAISVVNRTSSLLEIDRLAAAPPGMGPGMVTPTPLTPISVALLLLPESDLSIVDLTVDEEMNLVIWMENAGPDPLGDNQINFTVNNNLEFQVPGKSTYEQTVTISPDVGELFYINTHLQLKATPVEQNLEVKFNAVDFVDPNQNNNSLSLSFSSSGN